MSPFVMRNRNKLLFLKGILFQSMLPKIKIVLHVSLNSFYAATASNKLDSIASSAATIA